MRSAGTLLLLATVVGAASGCYTRAQGSGWSRSQPRLASGEVSLTEAKPRERHRMVLQTSPDARGTGLRASRCAITVRGAATWSSPRERGDGPSVVRVSVVGDGAKLLGLDVRTQTAIAVRAGVEAPFAATSDWVLDLDCPPEGACARVVTLEFEWIYPEEEGSVAIEWSVDTTLSGAHWRRVKAPDGARVSRHDAPPEERAPGSE